MSQNKKKVNNILSDCCYSGEQAGGEAEVGQQRIQNDQKSIKIFRNTIKMKLNAFQKFRNTFGAIKQLSTMIIIIFTQCNL